jgi:hypothetical protein
MDKEKILELEVRISTLEDWIKILTKHWNGTENLDELKKRIEQANEFRKINHL